MVNNRTQANRCKKYKCKPLLFVLIADKLNRMIKKTKNAGLISGLLGYLVMAITNLQHADGTLIFGQDYIRRLLLSMSYAILKSSQIYKSISIRASQSPLEG